MARTIFAQFERKLQRFSGEIILLIKLKVNDVLLHDFFGNFEEWLKT